MSKPIISIRRDEYNRIQKEWKEFFQEPLKRLIEHNYQENNYSQKEIADIIDWDPSTVSREFPKNGGGK